MSSGEIAYMSLVIAAMASFAIVLAWVTHKNSK